MALDLLVRALEAELPGQVVLADAGYGASVEFRNGLVTYGLDYAVGIKGTSQVCTLDARGRPSRESISALDLGLRLGRKAFRHFMWRDGTRWLVIEWPDGESKPTKFTLTTLPRRMRKKPMVCTIKERWCTEQAYAALKGELGLNHYEGRSFPGLNHHVSVVLCCYAFVVAERVRLFPPLGGMGPSRSFGRQRGLSDTSRIGSPRLVIARVVAGWLPRCPLCLRASPLTMLRSRPQAAARSG